MAAKLSTYFSKVLRIDIQDGQICHNNTPDRPPFNSFQAKAKFEKYNLRVLKKKRIEPMGSTRTFRKSKADTLRRQAIHNAVKKNLTDEERKMMKKLQASADGHKWKTERQKKKAEDKKKFSQYLKDSPSTDMF